MKSSLVFFDSITNSKKGTYRGLLIFPIFILLNLLWYNLTYNLYSKHIDNVNNYRKIFALFITGSLIVSALGVHRPATLKTATVYSGLVALVIYTISNLKLLSTSSKWTYKISLIDTMWGILSTILLGIILYYAVNKYPNILKAV